MMLKDKDWRIGERSRRKAIKARTNFVLFSYGYIILTERLEGLQGRVPFSKNNSVYMDKKQDFQSQKSLNYYMFL